MKNHIFNKSVALILAVSVIFLFSSCGSKSSVTDVVSNASSVNINGTDVTTVEARLGAFSGKSGDYIEFKFDEPQKINSIFINEKTAAVSQFNIYGNVDGELKMLYAGTKILTTDYLFDEVSVSTLRIEVASTSDGNDEFIIQGISAYYIENKAEV